MAVINNRYEFVIYFDVLNGNPNGDPDNDNMPRVDTSTGLGYVTDTCLKSKIRKYISYAMDEAPGYRIFIKQGIPLQRKIAEICERMGIPADDKALREAKSTRPDFDMEAVKVASEEFYDIRAFGGVLTTFQKVNSRAGAILGPVQLTFGYSVDPIAPKSVTITRQAITTEKDSENKKTEIGIKPIIHYGLYRAEGYISPMQAKKWTGFSESDLELFWKALINMFDTDHSAARGKMAVRSLIVFKHDTALGNAPSNELLERVSVQRKPGVSVARKFSDYDLIVNDENMPTGVEKIKLV